MKEVIDLQGNKILVPKDTVVRTGKGGIHYLLTPEEQAEFDAKNVASETAEADYIANEKYKDDRKKAYASVEDQLDMIYWDKKNGTNTFTDHIDAVKTAHPKPTE